jgi:hypothetical protein
MATKWIVLSALTGILAIVVGWLFYWATLPDQRGQAMPAVIVPVAVCAAGVLVLGVTALVMWLT